jgi:hypothetical protein
MEVKTTPPAPSTHELAPLCISEQSEDCHMATPHKPTVSPDPDTIPGIPLIDADDNDGSPLLPGNIPSWHVMAIRQSNLTIFFPIEINQLIQHDENTMFCAFSAVQVCC